MDVVLIKWITVPGTQSPLNGWMLLFVGMLPSFQAGRKSDGYTLDLVETPLKHLQLLNAQEQKARYGVNQRQVSGGWAGRLTYPQNPEALGQAPAAEKVNLKLVVQNDDGVFLPKLGVGLGVRVDDALRARPPLQKHDQLCKRPQQTHIYPTRPP